MIKNIAWNAFKNTGDINAFLEFKQISDIQSQMQKVEQNEYIKDEWNNNIGK